MRRPAAGGGPSTPLPVDGSEEMARHGIDPAERDQLAGTAQDLLDPDRERLALVECRRGLGLVPRGPVGRPVEAGHVLRARSPARVPLPHRERHSRCVPHRPVRIVDVSITPFELAPFAMKLPLDRLVRLPVVPLVLVQLHLPRAVGADEIRERHDLGAAVARACPNACGTSPAHHQRLRRGVPGTWPPSPHALPDWQPVERSSPPRRPRAGRPCRPPRRRPRRRGQPSTRLPPPLGRVRRSQA